MTKDMKLVNLNIDDPNSFPSVTVISRDDLDTMRKFVNSFIYVNELLRRIKELEEEVEYYKSEALRKE
jgi:hypothetical protein